MKTITFKHCASLAAVAFGVFAGSATSADEVADFYRGKPIDLILSTGVGGFNDLNAQLLLEHMAKYIPGKPNYVAKNMPGAGHVRASNYLYNRARRDGTTIGAFVRFFVLHQALGGKGVKYDAREFNYLGSTLVSNAVVQSWHTSGMTTLTQARKKELIVGGTGVGSGSVNFPTILNALLDTKFKIVQGYKSGNDIDLAMQRGEVFGRDGHSFVAVNSVHPNWNKDKKVHILAQIGLAKEKGCPNIPLVTELAKNDGDWKVLKLYSGVIAVGAPIFTNQGVPKARVAALRKAFDTTMKDPAYLAAAKKVRPTILPTSGAELAKIVNDVINSPPDIIGRAKEAVRRKGLIKCKTFTSAKYCYGQNGTIEKSRTYLMFRTNSRIPLSAQSPPA